MRRGSRKPAQVEAAVPIETVGVTVLPGVPLPEWLEPELTTEPAQESVTDAVHEGPPLDPSQIATMDATALMAAFAALQAQSGLGAGVLGAGVPGATTGAEHMVGAGAVPGSARGAGPVGLSPAPAATMTADRSTAGAAYGPKGAGWEHELVGAGALAAGAGMASAGVADAGVAGAGVAPAWGAASPPATSAPSPAAPYQPPIDPGHAPSRAGAAPGAWGDRPDRSTSAAPSSYAGGVPGDSSLLAPSPFVTAPGGRSLSGFTTGSPPPTAPGYGGFAGTASPSALTTPGGHAGPALLGYAGAAPVGYPGGAPVGYPVAPAGAPVGYAGAPTGQPGPTAFPANPAGSPPGAFEYAPGPFDRSVASPSDPVPRPNVTPSDAQLTAPAAAGGAHELGTMSAVEQAGFSPAAHAPGGAAQDLPTVPGLSPEQVALAKRYLELVAAGQMMPEPGGSAAGVGSPGAAAVASRRGSRRRKGLLVATTAALAAAGIVGGAWLAFPGLLLADQPEPAASSDLAMPASVNGLVALTDPTVGEAMVPLIGFGLRPSGVTVTAAYGTEPSGPLAMAAMATTAGSPSDAPGQIDAWVQRTSAEVDTPVVGTGATQGITCATTAGFTPSGSFCVWTDGAAVRGQTYVVGESAQAALTRTADLRLAMAAWARPAT